jgi:hypothetical protein
MSLFTAHDATQATLKPKNGVHQPPYLPIWVVMVACMPIFFVTIPGFRPIGIGIQLIGLIAILILQYRYKKISKSAFATCMMLFAILAAILAWVRFSA